MSFNSKRNEKKMKVIRTINTTHTAGTLLLAVALSLSAAACAGEKPVYVSTPDKVYTGSIYYVQAECTSCHGGEWDGNGPETKNMKAAGFNPTSFTGEVPAEKTPVDYFKSISDPAQYFAATKAKVSEADFNRFVGKHTHHNMTDRARWAIAHFLFSRHSGDPYSKNKSAIDEKMKEVKTVYAEKRRWELGYTPIAQKSTTPSLDEMISKSLGRADDELSMPSVTDERKTAAVETGTGASIYRTDCRSCHGEFAEGSVEGPSLGLLNQGPSIENDKGINRRTMAYVSVPDLSLTAGINSIGDFKKAHGDNSSMMVPSIQNLSDSEWQDLYNYTKRLSGR